MQRQLTKNEKRQIERRLKASSQFSNNLLAALFCFMFVQGIGLLVLGKLKIDSQISQIVLSFISFILALLVFWRMNQSLRRLSSNNNLSLDLQNGVAEEESFFIVEAIKVIETEDEGSSYFLKLDSGKILYLSGQYLYDEEEKGHFPNTSILIARAPFSKELLDFRCLGEPLEVAAELPSWNRQDYMRNRVPDDGSIVTIDFEKLKQHERIS